MQKDERANKAPGLLRGLNSAQKQAVENTEGPSLILAGAGSGKTKVLTHKVAYLIARKKVAPVQILALTFTNKAAKEMQQRISQLVKHNAVDIWCSTFHSFFARLLRRDCDKLGFAPNFAIYDVKDQVSLIKLITKDLKIEHESYSPAAIHSKISRLKNKFISPEQFTETITNPFDGHVAVVYPEYQKRLIKNNAMDFDDLLVKPIELFENFSTVLQYYQNFWRYILVDEYQDTNNPQYSLLKMLAATHQNLSVVGDDDQSIYRWRGANIGNILEFENDFPDCKIFRLEQNYRSTANILAVANSIILNNSSRMEKELWTKKEPGEKVTLLSSFTGDDEAQKIVSKIQEEVHERKRNFSDFAILYRTNAQSRVLEAGLRVNGVAYVIVAGTRFYERKEIKDVLAYLRLICNPLDEISIRRVINYPLRGIGDATIRKIDHFCADKNISFFKGVQRVDEVDGISEKVKQKISHFYKMIMKYCNLKDSISAIELATTLVEEIGILQHFKDEGTTEALNRRENIMELLTEINTFSKHSNGAVLSKFLEEVALITDIDNWNAKANAVTLMTLHAAKGLEFPVVFIAGLEEGLLPLARNMQNDEDFEEERRLFYVGATRAKEKLYLSLASERFRYGETFSGKPSQFVTEIKQGLLLNDSSPVFSKSRITTSRIESQPRAKQIIVEPKKKSLRKGAYVKHPQFGKGIIKNLEGKGDNLKAIIIFEEVGEKKIVVKYTKLEKL